MLSPRSARLLRGLIRAQFTVAVLGGIIVALFWGLTNALGFVCGAGLIGIGTWVAASRSFGAPAGPTTSMGRIWLGLAFKWFFLGLMLYLAIAVLRLPPVPLIAGLLAAQLGFLALAFQSDRAG